MGERLLGLMWIVHVLEQVAVCLDAPHLAEHHEHHHRNHYAVIVDPYDGQAALGILHARMAPRNAGWHGLHVIALYPGEGAADGLATGE